MYIDYVPTNDIKVLQLRLWVFEGNFFNRGWLSLSDSKEAAERKDPSLAGRVYAEVKGVNSIPVWRALLGGAFWLTGAGIPIAALIWGGGSGSQDITLLLTNDTPSLTLYYHMTGCTAFGDYLGTVNIPVSAMEGDGAYFLDVQGSCGLIGIGNWAGVYQRAIFPNFQTGFGFNKYPIYIRLELPNPPPPYDYLGSIVFTPLAIVAPWGYTGEPYVGYPYVDEREVETQYGTRVQRVTRWGAIQDIRLPIGNGGTMPVSASPIDARLVLDWTYEGTNPPAYSGVPGAVYLHYRNSPFNPSGFSFREGESLWWSSVARYRVANWNTDRYVSASFTPRLKFPGTLTLESVSGEATGGGETKTGIPGIRARFTPSPNLVGLPNTGRAAVGAPYYDTTWSPSFSQTRFSWTLGSYPNACTLRNVTSDETITIYELTPPGTYSADIGSVATYTAPVHVLRPGQQVTVGTYGLYMAIPGYEKRQTQCGENGCWETSRPRISSTCRMTTYVMKRQWNAATGTWEDVGVSFMSGVFGLEPQ